VSFVTKFSRRLILPRNGFTLLEVLISVAITAIVMAAVYGILRKGQEAAHREPEISALQQNARSGLSTLDRDLTLAGYKTLGAASLIWSDGGGPEPDAITILYADPEVSTSLACLCRRGLPCEMLQGSSVFHIKPTSFDPAQPDPTEAYSEGMILVAMEESDCNKDGKIGIYPFQIQRTPRLGKLGELSALTIRHEPAPWTPLLKLPASFNEEVHPDCAMIGRFRIVQYRIHPLPPAPHPSLERRDLSMGEEWAQVADNIENLQLMYAAAATNDFVDNPPLPDLLDHMTWVTQVKVTVTARADEEAHLRKSFSTTVSLRNMIAQIQQATHGRTYN
jgi:prepilin-type N-terminal cleavage/methylation domain-containing protein